MAPPLRLVFYLFFAISSTAQAQNFLPSFFSGGEATQSVPDEYFVARIPGLGPIYGARASWYFFRPPFIWAQGQLYDMRKLNLPQWDKNQVPLAISPVAGPAKVTIILEASDGTVIEERPFEAPFVPDRYVSPKGEAPARYRLQMILLNGRVKIKTGTYPWVQRQKVFDCEYAIDQDADPLQDGRVKTCLSSLESISKTAEQQWYATITWPETGNVLRRNAILARDREIRSAFRKAGHVYETERKGRTFLVRAGVTSVETLPVHQFDYETLGKREAISFAAEREDEKTLLAEAPTAAGGHFWVYSFANDTVEQAAIRSPAGPVPAIHIQFVNGTDKDPQLVNTEFLENRTGVPGLFRRWRGRVFLSQSNLTSSRGEKSELISGPGIDWAYSWDFLSLEPYVIYDSGLLSNSKLSISELQAGLGRGFPLLPSWSYIYGGFHQYQLSGQNPGSTRLGATDSIAFGLGGLQRMGKHYLSGRVAILVSTATGFDSRFEYGQVWHKKSDFHLTWGVFIGSSRYSGRVSIPTNRTVQTLAEDRFVFGVSIGFLGPEGGKAGFSDSQSP